MAAGSAGRLHACQEGTFEPGRGNPSADPTASVGLALPPSAPLEAEPALLLTVVCSPNRGARTHGRHGTPSRPGGTGAHARAPSGEEGRHLGRPLRTVRPPWKPLAPPTRAQPDGRGLCACLGRPPRRQGGCCGPQGRRARGCLCRRRVPESPVSLTLLARPREAVGPANARSDSPRFYVACKL